MKNLIKCCLKLIVVISVLVASLSGTAIENTSPVYVSNLLDAVALAENNNSDILVIFTADWCVACQKMKKDIETDISETLSKHIVCYIEYDHNKDLVREYNVKKIPHYFILRKRIEIKKQTGYKNFMNFRKWLLNE
jgi:thioredoxin-related protein